MIHQVLNTSVITSRSADRKILMIVAGYSLLLISTAYTHSFVKNLCEVVASILTLKKELNYESVRKLLTCSSYSFGCFLK